MVEPDDLVQFGLIPELVGRLPVTTVLDELNADAMLKVLTEPRNAIVKQYQKLFAMDDIQLTFQPEALEAVVALAMKRKTGARGLRAAMEHVLQPYMYALPSRGDVAECLITRDVVEQKGEPLLVLRKKPRKQTA